MKNVIVKAAVIVFHQTWRESKQPVTLERFSLTNGNRILIHFRRD